MLKIVTVRAHLAVQKNVTVRAHPAVLMKGTVKAHPAAMVFLFVILAFFGYTFEFWLYFF